MKKILITVLIIGVLMGGVFEILGIEGSEPEVEVAAVVEESPEPEVTEVIPESEPEEVTETERLGVSETELAEIESVMRVAGWEYDRTDFERVYRLKDEEMAMNPAVYAEYDVTLVDGLTHRVTLNRKLID